MDVIARLDGYEYILIDYYYADNSCTGWVCLNKETSQLLSIEDDRPEYEIFMQDLMFYDCGERRKLPTCYMKERITSRE